MHRPAFVLWMVSALFLYGCSSPNPDAPTGGFHVLDGSYLEGSRHGPDARQDLTACQACHGEAGGPGSNPPFNVGIDAVGGEGCEGCHGPNLAHPRDWAGVNSTFHYSAGNILEACTLCHGADLDGVGGVGVSCLGCHDSATAFTLDCSFCHGYPPDGTLHAGTVNGVDHSAVPLADHYECTFCHGVSESVAGGGFKPAPNYALFDMATGTIGDHWDGNIQMTAEAYYDSTSFNCGTCHDYDPGAVMSDSGLTVILKSMY